MIHEYKLRPYHNPEGVDESKVPDGWRFRYADEAGTIVNTRCRMWCHIHGFPSNCSYCSGAFDSITYIVPVTP